MTDKEEIPTKKKSFLSKLIGWIIKAIILIVIFYYILMYFEGRQEEFITKSINAANVKCNNDKSCLKNVKIHGRSCVEKHHHQERVRKKVQKSVLDEDAFYACLESFK